MKKYILIILGLAMVIPVYAQVSVNAVTFTISGNNDIQLTIDGTVVNMVNASADGNKTIYAVSNLQNGQHTFLVTRTNQNNKRREQINSSFTLRYGYNMRIKVNPNGSLELTESKIKGTGSNPLPMDNASFNTLLQNVRNQRSNNGRKNVITNAFNNTATYFTSSQVSQLLQLVTSESSRLELAKLSYRDITDRENFYLVVNLMYSQSSRDDLQSYVDNYYEDDNLHIAMSDADFNALYQTIRQQWPASTQVNSLTNAFNNTNNYFSTYQARQLIQLVNGESTRLQLAKLSYRSLTDPLNYTQLNDLFNRQASRDELAAYVNNYNVNDNMGAAMSDTDFNVLYQNIRQQWPVSTQINSLTAAFNNSNNYFSSYQASQLIQLVTSDANRLPLAKLSYRSITDRQNFNQVVNLLNYQASRDELNAYINNYTVGNNYGTAMSDANFNNLYQTIRQQWPVSTQINSLNSAFNNTNNYFTSYQASQLIQLVTTDANRLPLAKLSYRSITDRQNFNLVFNLLSYQSSRDELTAYVNNFTGGYNNNYGTAMPDAQFNTLYQSIQGKFFPNEKMSTMTDLFTSTTDHFSCAQVKQLIALVSFESNRLQLAKLSYRTIVDRGNFTQLYDLFNSQASKDELDAYVRNYRD